MRTILLLLAVFILNMPSWAQTIPPITQQEKTSTIESIARLLSQNYVFPDKAEEMGQYLKRRHRDKAYKNSTDYRAFADTLTGDLQKAHKDLHMSLSYAPQQVKMVRQWQASPEPSSQMLEEELRISRQKNFGFVKVERLPGNIGYLDFRQFHQLSEEAKKTAAAAMTFLAATDAIIIDLRQNGGGDPSMVQVIMSYFFDGKPVHYNSIYDRPTNTTNDYYTLAEVEGKKMADKDLYVLTSGGTFSGAEEFAYNMQNLKRATIIGETTGGGAHPVGAFVVNEYMVIDIPIARAISPITKTNWEGKGVKPEIEIEAEKALLKAQQLALTKLLAKTSDAVEKNALEWKIQALNAMLNPVPVKEELQKQYAGNYGERVISLESDGLYYRRNGSIKRKMIPITEDVFQLKDLDYFRIKMVRNESGKVLKLQGLYDNGTVDESVRTEQ